MAHGFGAVRHFGLPRYAERFAAAGMAVFLFDYRTFGDSDGEPRQLVDPRRHVEDWQSALAHVRTRREVDPDRIALWGTSYSGGHVIVTAAQDHALAAIVLQVPFVDPFTSMAKAGPLYLLQALPHGILDVLRAALGLPPHYVKVVGTPEEFAALNTPESLPGFLAIMDPSSRWENKCCARILFTFPAYRPIGFAPQVRCPALVLIADEDSLVSAKMVRKAAAKMSKAEIATFACAHFEIYTGPQFETAISRQITFLKQNLAA
jgi:pimeloyl-ACP methyl ester carboxylesterase